MGKKRDRLRSKRYHYRLSLKAGGWRFARGISLWREAMAGNPIYRNRYGRRLQTLGVVEMDGIPIFVDRSPYIRVGKSLLKRYRRHAITYLRDNDNTMLPFNSQTPSETPYRLRFTATRPNLPNGIMPIGQSKAQAKQLDGHARPKTELDRLAMAVGGYENLAKAIRKKEIMEQVKRKA